MKLTTEQLLASAESAHTELYAAKQKMADAHATWVRLNSEVLAAKVLAKQSFKDMKVARKKSIKATDAYNLSIGFVQI
jgi:type II secretory pathway component PulK